MKNRISLLLPAFLLLLPVLSSGLPAVDTTFSFLFRVKMAKAVDQGLINPDSGTVYAVSETGFGTVELAKGSNDVYEGVLSTGLDSGLTYDFRFRINDSVYENVIRQITALPGVTEYTAWWNDDPINITTFNVDMTYMVLAGAFDPDTDSMDITGTMNGWAGSPLMQRVGATDVFQLSMDLDPGMVYQYKYRVNRDTAKTEFLNGFPRYFRVPDTLITLNQYFYDYNPATVPMTFICDLRYQTEAGSFDPETDFVDVAGNFNNGGAWDLLYRRDGDSLFRGTLFFDTTLIGGAPLAFKFRINGDPAEEELAGKPPRSYTLHSPMSGPNYFYCWYDDIDPTIPTPPWVTDLFIQGTLISGNTVTGIYSYKNLNGIPEGGSLYQWYKTDSIGGAFIAIDSAWQVNYTIDSTQDIGKYLVFMVVPVAAYGDSTVGKSAFVYSDWKVGGVGIGEQTPLQVSLFPNPVEEHFTVLSNEKNLRMEITDLAGHTVISRHYPSPGLYRESVGSLPSGIYMVLFKSASRSVVQKLIRR